MARAKTLRVESREDWEPIEGAPTRGGIPAKPLRAILAGGNATYGNVRKIPERLWRDYGITVVRHVHDVSTVRSSEKYDLAICLVDQGGHGIMAKSREIADKHVNCPSSYTSIKTALELIDIPPYPGSFFTAPPPKPPTHAVFRPGELDKLIESEPHIEEEETPVAQAAAPLQPLPESIKKALRALKPQMEREGIGTLMLTYDPKTDKLEVNYRRVVTFEGETSL